MPKDLREIVKESQNSPIGLPEGHQKRFEERLKKLEQPAVNNRFLFLKIAASLLILLGLGYFFRSDSVPAELPVEVKITNLGSISPEMKQIENYYLTAINYEMASLDVNPQSKQILNTYLEKVAGLTEDYKQLTEELAQKGIDERTINSLITNLQLRLQLLLELKDAINDLKTENTLKNEKLSV